MTLDDIIWEDPPVLNAGRPADPAKAEFIEALKAHPGKWAIYPRDFPSSGSAGGFSKDLRGAKQKDHTPTGIESCTRTKDGITRVYARWVGLDPEAGDTVNNALTPNKES